MKKLAIITLTISMIILSYLNNLENPPVILSQIIGGIMLISMFVISQLYKHPNNK